MAATLPVEIEAKLGTLRPSGDGWVTKCIVHEDNKPSLSIKLSPAGKLLVHCHAGCDPKSILDALGYEPPARDEDRVWTPRGDAVAVYDYRDESGTTLFQVLRTAEKEFPQRVPDSSAKSGWRWKLGDTRRVLYRLPELLQGIIDGKPVWVVEGEKDVHALVDHGQIATCNPGGAGKWRPEYSAFFIDATVTVWADNDEPGQKHARQVAASLEGVANAVRIVEAAEGHKDAAAHLGAGFGTYDVRISRDDHAPAVADLAQDIHEFLDGPEPEYDWIVPGLLEREERLMLTGWEGFGKSVLNRQLAMCFAAGIHPFTEERVEPVKVLFVDCENPTKLARRSMRPIRDYLASINAAIPTGNLRVVMRSEGVDLTTDEHAEWLLERVMIHAPDVLFIGPIYKMHESNPNDEQPARQLIAAIDAARTKAHCAVIIEAHAGNGEVGHHRSMRPFGASIYRRWVDFGYGLNVHQTLTVEKDRSPLVFQPWKGPRDERDWPDMLRRGIPGRLPWVATEFIEEQRFAGRALA